MSFSSWQRLDAIRASPNCSLRAKERSNRRALPDLDKSRIYRTVNPMVLSRIAETRLAGTFSLTERLIELTLWLGSSAKDAGNQTVSALSGIGSWKNHCRFQTGESVVKNPEPMGFTVFVGNISSSPEAQTLFKVAWLLSPPGRSSRDWQNGRVEVSLRFEVFG